jgi:uncharacterized protein YdhG (YjbR/CyaY superfamily)
MDKSNTAKNVDDYLNRFSGEQRVALEQLRKAIVAAAPKAQEAISYGMPAYRLNGIVAYFGGFKNHCSYFPGSYAVISQFKDELNGFEISKGTIRFALGKPIPISLIKKMVKAKILENEQRRPIGKKQQAAKRQTAK